MSDMSFSGGFETMAAGKDTEGWIEVLHMGALFVGVLGQVPWMQDIIALAPSPGPIITFQQFAGRKAEETSQKNSGMRQDILSIIKDESSGGLKLSKLQASADASFIVLAGSDTISEAMVSLMRYLVGDPKFRQRCVLNSTAHLVVLSRKHFGLYHRLRSSTLERRKWYTCFGPVYPFWYLCSLSRFRNVS